MAVLGLGFSFSGKDAGLSNALSSIGDGFKKVGKSALALSGVQSVFDKMSFAKLDELKQKMTSLGGHPIDSSALNLTTGLEAQMQQMDAALRKTGMGFGHTGKKLGVFSNQSRKLAYSLGIAEDAAANAVQAMEYLKDSPIAKASFARLGLKNAAAFAKFGDALPGVNVEKFTYAIKQMTESMGMTADDVTLLIANAEQYGKASGNVADALNSVAEMQELIQQQKNIFGKSTEDARSFVTSTYQLGTALEKVGFSGGLALSKGIAEKITMTGEEWEKLVSGAQSEIPGLITTLGITGQNSDKMFAAMRKGPKEFVSTVIDQLSTLKDPKQLDDALRFFSSHMKSVFDPKMVENLRSILKDEQLRTRFQAALTGSEIKNAAADTLKKYADGRRSTITAQEAYERAHEAFTTRLANLGSFSSWGFVKDAQRSFNDFGNLLQSIKKQGGVGKSVVTMIGDIQRVGAAGLFPKNMQAEMIVFGDIAKKLSSPLKVLKDVGFDLLSPMGFLSSAVGILGARFFVLWSKTKDAKKAFIMLEQEVLKFVTETVPNAVRKGVSYLADAARAFLDGGLSSADPSKQKMLVLGKKIFTGIKDGLVAAGNFIFEVVESFIGEIRGEDLDTSKGSVAIGAALGRMAKNALAWFQETVVPAAKQFWDGLTGNIVMAKGDDGTMQQGLANKIGLWLNGALIFVWEKVKGFASALWAGFTKELMPEDQMATIEGDLGYKLGSLIRNGLDAAIEAVKTYISEWWTKMGDIWNDPDMTFSEKVDKMFSESLPLIIGTALLAPGLITTVSGYLVGFLGAVIGGAAKMVWDIGFEFLKPALGRLGTSFATWLFETALPGIWNMLLGAGRMILGFFGRMLWPAVVAIWDGIVTAIGAVVATLSAPVALIIAAIVLLFAGLFLSVRRKGESFKLTMLRVWDEIRFGAAFAWASIKDAAVGAYRWMVEKTYVMQKTLSLGFTLLGLHIKDVFLTAVEAVQLAFFGMMKAVSEPLSKLMKKFGDTLVAIGEYTPAALGGAAILAKGRELQKTTSEDLTTKFQGSIDKIEAGAKKRTAEMKGVETALKTVSTTASEYARTQMDRLGFTADAVAGVEKEKKAAAQKLDKKAADEAQAANKEAADLEKSKKTKAPAKESTPTHTTAPETLLTLGEAPAPLVQAARGTAGGAALGVDASMFAAAPTLDLSSLTNVTNKPAWVPEVTKKLDDLIGAIKELKKSGAISTRG